jgi:hypothetical protein
VVTIADKMSRIAITLRRSLQQPSPIKEFSSPEWTGCGTAAAELAF